MRLFEPVRMGTLELKNRLVMPPMFSHLAEPGGTVSPAMIDYYARRARGGMGLIEVELTAIDPHQFTSPLQLRISDDSYIPSLAGLAQGIKENGARAAIQLHHPGRQALSRVTGRQPVGPSPIASSVNPETPRELTVEEIRGLVDLFAQAARRAGEAGFDAIELHGAHGYLLCQFLSPRSNHRRDEYGGDIRGRARFPLEIVAAIRREVGRDFPIIFRFSADEHTEGGLTLEETRPLARMLEAAGVDALHVSAGTDGTLAWAIQPILLRRGYLVPLAAAIKEEVGVPVITVGRINDPKLAESILEQGKADLVAVGRPLLADPDFASKAREGRPGEVKRCIACNSCRPRDVAIGCLLNPEAGREGLGETGSPRPRRVLVVGGGPAGLEAARVARLRGHDVTLWDEDAPPEARWSWLLNAYVTDRAKTLKSLGVHRPARKRATPEAVAELNPDVTLVTPRAVWPRPSIPGSDGENVVPALEVLSGKREISGEAAVLGAGNVGCEVARFLDRRGVAVTVLESGDRPGRGLDDNLTAVLLDDLRRRGVRFLTGVRVTAIEGDGVRYRDSQGNEASLDVGTVVLAPAPEPSAELASALKERGLEVRSLPFCAEPRNARGAGMEGAEIAREIG
ncbi:MAG: FAD-dependent oxidoreductase [Dehalococcoidia bacterium]